MSLSCFAAILWSQQGGKELEISWAAPRGILFCPAYVVSQDVNGVKLGMTRAEVCQFVITNSAYHIEKPAACPEVDDFVTVEVTTPSSPDDSRIQLTFHDDTVHAIWTTFPTAEFFNIFARLEADYEKPELVCAMAAGHTEIKSGPYRENKHATDASDLLHSKSAHSSVLPEMAVLGFTDGYLYWRVNGAHVILEQQNELIDGKMTGWFAMIAPDTSILNSR
ncbi:hypothetical protein EDE15_4799 [Edaphobacter aggregans]|uniref:Uncharacterized protein n=1 Tax=Edaphobacter aggregans TaxID=570835 RepID=A0A3R9QE59_9BACT|nr:hypothetical protein [Edaphobacter aggregans]RSL19156.1 hypothetical protein EDE15_4799 [Edaphobacter aggregans]